MTTPFRPRKPFLGTTILATLSSLAATPLYANEGSIALDKVVVVGNRAPAQISEIPGTVWVLEGEELELQTQGGQDLKTVLGKLVPSLDLAPESRTNFGQNLRGRSVLVMIDGVSLNSSRGVSRQFDSIDPFNIERIEVLSGATALYGGGSTGGIINIITKKGAPGGLAFTTEVGASSGFNDGDDLSFRAGQSVSGGNDVVNGRLAVAAQQNKAFFDADGDQVMPDITQTDLQYNRSIDVMGSLRFQLGKLQTLDVLAQLYNSQYEGDRHVFLGNNFSQLLTPEIRSGFDSDRTPETDRYLFNIAYQHLDLLGHTAMLQLSTRSEDLSFHPYPRVNTTNPANSSVSASQQTTTQTAIKGVLVKEVNNWQFSYGLDLDTESFDSDQMVFDTALALQSGNLQLKEAYTVGRYPDYQVQGMAGFFQTEWQATDHLRLSAGIRQQHSELDIDDFIPRTLQIQIAEGLASGADPAPGGTNSYDVTLANIGAIYDIADSHQIWTNFNQAFEIPDPGKVFGSAFGKGTWVPNMTTGYYDLQNSIDVDSNTIPGLKTNQIELGWRTAQSAWDAQAAAYYVWSDKTTEVTDELLIDVVDAKTRDYGLEASINYRIGNQWATGAQGHYIRSEVETNDQWEKKDARYASLPSAMVFVEWRDELNAIRLQGSKAFDVEDDAEREIEGFTTVDLQASHTLPMGNLTLGITNLLNSDYTTVWSQRAQLFYGNEALFNFKSQGRTYTMTYEVDY